MNFPIFDKLRLSINNKNKSNTDILDENDICSKINSCPQIHNEFILALIIHYFITISEGDIKQLEFFFNGNKKKKNLYNCEKIVGGNGLIFKLNNLPNDLKMIIKEYLTNIE